MKVEMTLLKKKQYQTRAFTVPNERWANILERAKIAVRTSPALAEDPDTPAEVVQPRPRGRPRKTTAVTPTTELTAEE